MNMQQKYFMPYRMDDEPEEGDLLTEDYIHFFMDSKLVLTIRNPKRMSKEIKAWMDKEKWYPNVFWI